MGSFLALMGVYSASVLTAAALLRRSGRSLPDTVPLRDLVLGAVATHKVARLLSKDAETEPLRAPFTTFAGQAGEAEVAEEVRGSGVQHAVGELLTCPFCLDQWVGTGFVLTYLANPRLARLGASVMTIIAAADVLQFGYDALQPDPS